MKNRIEYDKYPELVKKLKNFRKFIWLLVGLAMEFGSIIFQANVRKMAFLWSGLEMIKTGPAIVISYVN